MPAEPLVEQIAQDIEAALRGAKTVAGFHNDLIVERIKQESNDPRDCLVVIAQGDEREAEEPHGQGRKEWIQPFEFTCYVIEPRGGRPIDRRINTIRADVQRAVMRDPQRGQRAVDTLLRGSQILPSEAGAQFAGVTVFVDVQYRVRLDDPNTKG